MSLLDQDVPETWKQLPRELIGQALNKLHSKWELTEKKRSDLHEAEIKDLLRLHRLLLDIGFPK